MNDSFEQLQADIVGKLESEGWFSDVPVVAYKALITSEDATLGEIAQERPWTVKKDGTHCGLGVQVRIPTLQVPFPNLPGPQSRLLCTITVVEQPLLSESSIGLNSADTGYKSAEKCALWVRRALHQFRYDGANLLYAEGDTIVPVGGLKDLRAYNVVIRGSFHEDITAKVEAVSVTIADGTCTLDCSTSGATIRYTIDGSYPGLSGNTYSSPFAVTSGQTVRAAATKTSLIGSDVSQDTVS